MQVESHLHEVSTNNKKKFKLFKWLTAKPYPYIFDWRSHTSLVGQENTHSTRKNVTRNLVEVANGNNENNGIRT